MLPQSLFLFTALLQISKTAAWGSLGHETIALIAQDFMTPAAITFSQNILGDTSNVYLANVSTWADSYRVTAEGKFSAPYHFIDAEDSPPTTCNVDLQRDCGPEGCVVAAIANYTGRVLDSKLSGAERFKALKFVVHFVGDVHQPLHDEALQLGGNGISVKFDGKTTNLHSVWDTAIPQKFAGASSIPHATSWAATLSAGIKSGVYSSQAASWLSGVELNDPTGTAMIWARDTNAYVCSTVLPNGVPAVQGGVDLSGAYYNGSISVVQLQITKAGYRLAAWLNLIATGDIGLSAASGPQKREPLSYLLPGETRDSSPAKLARRAFGHQC